MAVVIQWMLQCADRHPLPYSKRVEGSPLERKEAGCLFMELDGWECKDAERRERAPGRGEFKSGSEYVKIVFTSSLRLAYRS